MVRRRSIKLFDVFGIRVGVDISWFVMLFLIIFVLSGSFRNQLPAHTSDAVAYLTTVATVLLFFGSLILHELSHAVVARRQGIAVKRIELFLFGGLTQMSREARTPAEELKIAAAGPLATLGFVLVCLAVALAMLGPHALLHAATLSGDIRVTPVSLSLAWLVVINVLILCFNLVPAFPLDGGRIARAIVWRVTGDRARGTRVSARLGEGFAVLLAGVGAWMLVASGFFGGVWLLALAFMLGQSARGALLQTHVSERIDGVKVADIMDRQPVAIPASTPVADALDSYFRRYDAAWLPVVDAQEHFLGIARRERVEETAHGPEAWLTIGSVLAADDASTLRIDENEPLTQLLSLESLGRLGAVMAVDREGVLRGVVTLKHVQGALQAVLGSPAAR